MAEMQTTPPPPGVSVTLLLEGGLQYMVMIPSNNLLLQQLFETVVNPPEKRSQRVFQIPVNEGKAMLCFPSDRLVGMITEPPLVIQQQPQPSSQAEPQAADTATPNLF